MKIKFIFKKNNKPTTILIISLILLIGYVIVFAVALHPIIPEASANNEEKVEI